MAKSAHLDIVRKGSQNVTLGLPLPDEWRLSGNAFFNDCGRIFGFRDSPTRFTATEGTNVKLVPNNSGLFT